VQFSFDASQRAQKIFVLGGTGFIGFAVVRRLAELGFQNVWCLYRDQDKRERMFSSTDTSSITFLQGDVSQGDVLRKGIEEAAIVLNASGVATGWGDKGTFWDVNVRAAQGICGMIREMGAATHFLHITSASVYGFSQDEKTEESPVVVSDPFYTASKADIHSWLRAEIARERPFPITVLAPTIVWGPGDQIYIPGLMLMLKAGQMIYFKDAEPVDMVHIDDLVDAVLLCFFNEKAYNEEYIISGPTRFAFEPYIAKIAEFAGLPTAGRRVPVGLALGMASVAQVTARVVNLFRPSYQPSTTRLQVLLLSTPIRASIEKARKRLGYAPEIDFVKGIDSTKGYIQQLKGMLG